MPRTVAVCSGSASSRASTVTYKLSDDLALDGDPLARDAMRLARDSQVLADAPVTISLRNTDEPQKGEGSAAHAIGIVGHTPATGYSGRFLHIEQKRDFRLPADWVDAIAATWPERPATTMPTFFARIAPRVV